MMAECEILEGCVNLNPIKLSWIGFYLLEKNAQSEQHQYLPAGLGVSWIRFF